VKKVRTSAERFYIAGVLTRRPYKGRHRGEKERGRELMAKRRLGPGLRAGDTPVGSSKRKSRHGSRRRKKRRVGSLPGAIGRGSSRRRGRLQRVESGSLIAGYRKSQKDIEAGKQMLIPVKAGRAQLR